TRTALNKTTHISKIYWPYPVSFIFFFRSRLWVWITKGLLALGILYATLPFILRLFPGIVQHLVYKHAITYFVDLSRPYDLALNHTVNMYLSSEEGVTLGVWHTVPEHKWKEAQGKSLDWYEKSLGDGSPVFIYLHGNTGRFGDSTGEPTEAGLTTDALYLYHWVRARSKGSLVIFWGHSLGTAVSTNTAVILQEQGNPVDAVILEGAFLKPDLPEEELLKFPHPFTWYYWRFPYIQYFFKDLSKNKFVIPPVLKKMRTPLLILHSKDDHLAPFWMAEKVYSISKSALNSDKLVKLVPFDGSHGYLHNGLYRDPGLPGIIREFVQSVTA
uniref:AB hydrolase-1 domain-containing protein n=1 Tax=Electrophorus electricus TaxID=8005 RepID=A0A4W4EB01_ELEEL